MTRRSAVAITTGLVLTATGRTPAAPAPATAGRLKQSAARWCYSRIPLDELCRQAAELGLSGIDLVDSQDWPTLRKTVWFRPSRRARAEFPTAGTAKRVTNVWKPI